MIARQSRPTRFDIKVVKNMDNNIDLVGIAVEKIASNSRMSTESIDSKDVKLLSPIRRREPDLSPLPKNLGIKNMSSNQPQTEELIYVQSD